MCQLKVKVVEVDDDELCAPWAAVIDDQGHRAVLVRRTATPVEVCAAYSAALELCPVRVQLEQMVVWAVA